MEFAKLSAPSLKDLFVQQLQGMILSDELPMGTQLPPERELAQQMQVSRAVVNGGLAELAQQGILPLIYYSFKAPVITLWLRFCRMYGIGALCRNTETLYNYLCRRDMDGAERWIDAYLEQAIDGSQQIYEER